MSSNSPPHSRFHVTFSTIPFRTTNQKKLIAFPKSPTHQQISRARLTSSHNSAAFRPPIPDLPTLTGPELRKKASRRAFKDKPLTSFTGRKNGNLEMEKLDQSEGSWDGSGSSEAFGRKIFLSGLLMLDHHDHSPLRKTST